jgi:hypothetical protein
MMSTHTTPTSLSETDPARWQLWEHQGLPMHIGERLSALSTHSQADADQLDHLAEELDHLLAQRPVAVAIDRFLIAGDSFGQHCDRFTALRTFELIAGLPGRGVQWPGWQPAPGLSAKRPLRDLELGLIRYRALLHSDQLAAITATREAMATSGELASVETNDFDRSVDGLVDRVKLRGVGRARPRTNPIPVWARAAVTRWIDRPKHRDLATPVLYTGTSGSQTSIESALSMRLKNLLDDCGLHDSYGVSPESIRLGAARQLQECAGLDAVVQAVTPASIDRLHKQLSWPFD